MKENKIYEAITNIDDKKVLEADNFKAIRRPGKLAVTISAAAVFVASLVGIFAVTNNVPPLYESPTHPISSSVQTSLSPEQTPEYLTVSQSGVVDLLENIEKQEVSAPKEDVTDQITDFSLNVFKEIYSDEQNLLVSPLSFVSALGMSANGANADTLLQMEEVLNTDINKLNGYMANYIDFIDENQNESVSLNVANSIWYNNQDLQVSTDFLQNVANYYEPSVYAAPFDASTAKSVNDWVSEQTDGMIDWIIDEISPDSLAFLVNALFFDARWAVPYAPSSVDEGIFYSQDGSEQSAEFMWSNENSYIKMQNATGFVQKYASEEGEQGYSFVALLPNEGVSVDELISEMEGQELIAALNASEEPSETVVISKLPKFSFDYETELTSVLKSLGMSDAFDPIDADFSAMATSPLGNIFIDEVLHKTIIEVNEVGTKAGATSSAEVAAGEISDAQITEITLDQPFIFMIVDNSEHFPVFIGTVNSIETPAVHHVTITTDRDKSYETAEELEENASLIISGECFSSAPVYQNDTLYTLSQVVIDEVHKSPDNFDTSTVNIVEMGGRTTFGEYAKNVQTGEKSFDQGENQYPANAQLIIDIDGHSALEVGDEVLLYLSSADGFLEDFPAPLYSIVGDYEGKIIK